MSTKIFTLIIVLALSLQGCGGGSGNTNTPAIPEALTLKGAAVKGVVANAAVAAYEIDSAGVTATTALATSTTDENGDYSLDLPDSFTGGPLLLKLSANDDGSTTMKCDVADGCSGVTFGESFSVPENFELLAVLGNSSAGDEVTLNLTALTTLAAHYANSKTGGLTTENIDAANTQAADTFGLTGGIHQFTPVDLTDPNDVAAADPEAIANALYSAGVLAALLNDQRDIADGLTSLAEEFANQGGSLVVNDTGFDSVAISLLEIFESAQEIVDHIDEGGGAVAANLAVVLAEAAATNPGQRSEGEPSPNAGATNLAKAKAMIDDVRTIGAATTIAATETGAYVFHDHIQSAGTLVDQDTVDTVEALGKVFAAAGTVIDSLDFITLSLPFAQTYTELNGTALGFELSVNITETNEQLSLQLTVDDTVDGVAIELDGGTTLSGNTSEFINDDLTSLDGLTISITGNASKNGLSLIIDQGTIGLQTASLESETPAFEQMDVELNLILSQQQTAQVSNPVQFEGLLAFAIRAVEIVEEGDVNPDFVFESDEFENQGFTFETATFTLQGQLSDAEGHSLTASLAVNLDGDGFVAGILPLGFQRNTLFRYEVSEDQSIVDYFYEAPPHNPSNDVLETAYQFRTEFFSEQRFMDSGESVSSIFQPSYSGGSVAKFSAFDRDGHEVYPYFEIVGNEPLLIPLSLFGSTVLTADSALSFINLQRQASLTPPTQIVNGEGMYALEFPDEGLNPNGGIIGGTLVCKRECPFGQDFFIILDQDLFSDSIDNTLLGSVALSFSASLSGIDDLDVTVSANRTHFHRGDVDFNFNYGGRRFTINAPIDLDADDSQLQQLRVLNQDLVELRISVIDGEVSGELSILGDDEELGTVARENGVIVVRYNDDTFESFQ
ncbi:hypothetical protein NYF23_03685 [SAR92 clade bacterium H455]|uniref:Carboxypeptidase regulatory-like domain-containing protein n=1 Tax=SAR92 clade bacterium H455 TaxID=2974818 RepID=A0ABY5TRK8_9GAMM|nr:hypothetical protein NYF23_03685 [SAR92 clade bacterium H455]